MKHGQFVHLGVHTAFSLLEGAMHIKEIGKRAVEYGSPAIAMVDTNNLFGSLEFSETLKEIGIQPIIGVTLSLKNPFLEASKGGKAPEPDKVKLFAQNDNGYRNLLKLVSRAHLNSEVGEDPQVSMDDIEEFHQNIILLTGGVQGPIGRLIIDGKADQAQDFLLDLKAIFDNRLYLEIQRHGLREEDITESTFLDMAYNNNIPLVGTNSAFFMDADMYEAHDALMCIADGTYVAETNRRRLNPEHRLKSPKEMIELFADIPEAIENTLVIAQRTAFKVEKIDPILPNFADGKDISEEDMLKTIAEEGLKKRIESHVLKEDLEEEARKEIEKPYWDRLAFELNVINQMGFPGYFLIVADFIQWAKDHEVPVGPGRGSGAGSVVAWSLLITDLDPLRFGLLFERFLNPERVSMPDFDIDFCQDKRDQVIKYVQNKYGYDHVAQIITFGKLQAKAVIRDVGRVLQQPYGQTDRLSKLIPNNPANPVSLSQALKEEPKLKYEQQNDELTAAVIGRALKLEGLYRHASTHAAGVVIGDRPLDELVPLYRDPKSDMPVTQFNMKWVEKAGLVKFDFLGLKTLTVLAKAVEFIALRDIKVDLETIPLDDQKTYEMLAKGDSAGVFQLESTGMRSVLKGMRPDKFEDIIALVALYRPGPMDNIPSYVARKHGEEEPDYMHELLQPILEETYGVIIYQEQVMQIAQILSGYSLGEADLLRRAMGKKQIEEMAAQKERFVEGAAEKGVGEVQSRKIFEHVDKFAGYGFNKSHAAAYALVAYQTAYLKANFPVEFMAASMCLDINNTDKLASYKNELQSMDISLLQPDINSSGVEFLVENDSEGNPAIRYALAAIKNVGEKAMEAIVRERDENGPFKTLYDFAERVEVKQLNKRQLENLISAGSFDCITKERASVMAAAEIILRYAHNVAEQRESAQENLFGGPGEESSDRPQFPEVTPWSQIEALAQEKQAIGFYISSHPLEIYERALQKQNIVPIPEVLETPKYIGKAVKIAGVVDSFSERRSQKSGKPYGFLGLSDTRGGVEVLVFGDLLDSVKAAIETGGLLVATVSVDKRDEDETPKMVLRGTEPLDNIAARTGTNLEIDIRDDSSVENIEHLLRDHKGGRGKVIITVLLNGGMREVNIELAQNHKVTPVLRNAIMACPGVMDAREA